MSALIRAVRANRNPAVDSYLRHGACPNEREPRTNKTPLMIAVELGHFRVANTLLEFNAIIDLTDANENMAIHWAAKGGSLDCVQLLVHHGSLLDVLNRNFFTPLMMAVEMGHHDITRFLIARDPYIIRGLNRNGISEFVLAAGRNDRDIAQMIYETQVPDVDKEEELQYALHYAAVRNNIEALNYLKGMGVDFNSCEHFDYPVLFRAIIKSDIVVVDYLLKNGSNVNLWDKRQRTALMIAITEQSTDCINLLLNHGAEITPEALELARKTKNETIVELLERRRA